MLTTPTATTAATVTPTPVPGNKPRVNKSPGNQVLQLSAPSASQNCADSPDTVTVQVEIKDPITSPDPKTPTQTQMLGAFEFQTFFDPALVCLSVAPGAIPMGEMTCFTEQGAVFIQFGCFTNDGAFPPQPQPPGVLAIITVRPQPAAYLQLPPGSGLELVTELDNATVNLETYWGMTSTARAAMTRR